MKRKKDIEPKQPKKQKEHKKEPKINERKI
jgi:hypothetical protein